MTIATLFVIGALSMDQAPAASQSLEAREASFAAAIAAGTADFAPYRDLSLIYIRTGRRDEAERILRQALKVHPDSGEVFAALASLHSEPRDPEKLLAVADEWARAEPANPQPHMIMSQAHMALASAARPNSAEALAHTERAKGAYEEAGRLRESQSGPSTPQRATVIVPQLRSSAGSAFPNAIRVGGNVKVPTKIKDVKPVMPQAAIDAGVQGVVIIEIVINESGVVADARVLRSIPLLDAAALDAVKQWQFAPTELEGKRVPVILTVTVQFILSQ